MAKIKNNIKSCKRKTVTYHKMSANFKAETLQARRDWHEMFKVIKSKDLQPILLCPAKVSFKIEGEIKSFQGNKTQHNTTQQNKTKEFITNKPVSQDMLKGLL